MDQAISDARDLVAQEDEQGLQQDLQAQDSLRSLSSSHSSAASGPWYKELVEGALEPPFLPANRDRLVDVVTRYSMTMPGESSGHEWLADTRTGCFKGVVKNTKSGRPMVPALKLPKPKPSETWPWRTLPPGFPSQTGSNRGGGCWTDRKSFRSSPQMYTRAKTARQEAGQWPSMFITSATLRSSSSRSLPRQQAKLARDMSQSLGDSSSKHSQFFSQRAALQDPRAPVAYVHPYGDVYRSVTGRMTHSFVPAGVSGLISSATPRGYTDSLPKIHHSMQLVREIRGNPANVGAKGLEESSAISSRKLKATYVQECKGSPLSRSLTGSFLSRSFISPLSSPLSRPLSGDGLKSLRSTSVHSPRQSLPHTEDHARSQVNSAKHPAHRSVHSPRTLPPAEPLDPLEQAVDHLWWLTMKEGRKTLRSAFLKFSQAEHGQEERGGVLQHLPVQGFLNFLVEVSVLHEDTEANTATTVISTSNPASPLDTYNPSTQVLDGMLSRVEVLEIINQVCASQLDTYHDVNVQNAGELSWDVFLECVEKMAKRVAIKWFHSRTHKETKSRLKYVPPSVYKSSTPGIGGDPTVTAALRKGGQSSGSLRKPAPLVSTPLRVTIQRSINTSPQKNSMRLFP